MPTVDPTGDDMQIIISESLLRYISSAVWNNTQFLLNHNPTLGSDNIFMSLDGQIIQIPCTTDVMDKIFPGVA